MSLRLRRSFSVGAWLLMGALGVSRKRADKFEIEHSKSEIELSPAQ